MKITWPKDHYMYMHRLVSFLGRRSFALGQVLLSVAADRSVSNEEA